ncbi:MAG: hypothetical protein LJE74_06305 [Proteobacteria bacterium]|jgi:hypothetical protein|nr:hypothetical protein [Pseudomonadota bacterium]MCG6935186.1 hypothetical protein [Pseudomonadota bacterium]
MTHQDKPDSLATTEALAELRKLLLTSYETSLLLKRDVPSEEFPDAYKLSQSIRDLRKLVENLNRRLSNDASLDADFDLDLFRPDMLSSADSSASIC